VSTRAFDWGRRAYPGDDFATGDRIISFPSEKHPGEFSRGTVLGFDPGNETREPSYALLLDGVGMDGQPYAPTNMRWTTAHRLFRKMDVIERIGELA